MRNLVPDQQKYYENFADSVYAEFRKLRYGLATCTRVADLQLAEIRKEIVDFQMNDDGAALTDVSIQYMGWLPVYWPANNTDCNYQSPWTALNNYKIQRCSGGPTSIGLNYVGQNNSTNIIEVNAGGCITKINLNPVININNYNNSSFTYTQTTPSMVWYVTHNLNMIPNVFTEDQTGEDIDGVVTIIDNNNLMIAFSTAVAGKAYLS